MAKSTRSQVVRLLVLATFAVLVYIADLLIHPWLTDASFSPIPSDATESGTLWSGGQRVLFSVLGGGESSPVAAANSTAHATTHEVSSLFGILSSLDPIIATISFVMIVVAVLFVEFLFNNMHHVTFDTPFEHLLPAVEKELMIAGCTAFIFKVIVNTTKDLNPEWYHALEYADLIVPIFSFIYCFLGLGLITFSVHLCNVWSKAYHLKLLELLDEYFDFANSWQFRFSVAAFSGIVSEVEFRIFQNIFCDAYKIQKKAFAFNEYVQKVFEKFIMEIVEIRPIDWILVSLVFMLNLLRLITTSKAGRCDVHDYECMDHGMTQGFIVCGCLLLFCVIVVAVASRIIELRIFAKKGIPCIDTYHSYLEYMEELQENVEENKRMNVDQLKVAAEEAKTYHKKAGGKWKRTEILINRLSSRIPNFVTSSKKNAPMESTAATKSRKVKQTSNVLDEINKNRSYKRVVAYRPGPGSSRQRSSSDEAGERSDRYRVADNDGKEEKDVVEVDDAEGGESRRVSFYESEKSTQKYASVSPETTSEAATSATANAQDPDRVGKVPMLGTIVESRSISSMSQQDKTLDNLEAQVHPMLPSTASFPGSEDRLQTAPLQAIGENSRDDLLTSFSKSLSKLGSSSDMLNSGSTNRYSSKLSTKYKKEEDAPADNFTYNPTADCLVGDQSIASVFLFQNPVLYFETVQALIMLISLYLALWLTNFLVAAKTVNYIIVSLLPGLLSAVVYLYVVKVAALLKAVYVIDNDAVLEVLEQTEGSQILGETIRKKILERLKELGEPQAELFSLFNEIDASGNGWLSREEFAIFMNAIEINFSRKKWHQIYREIDMNYDDKISFQEFFLFLFPDHDVGLALENKRMKILGQRVKQKANQHMQDVKKRSGANAHPHHSAQVVPTSGDVAVEDRCNSPQRMNNVNINNRRSRPQTLFRPPHA